MLYEEWFNLNFYIPMDKVEENFRRATKVDAVTKEKFYFRTNIFDSGPPVIEELTLDEIFFGSSNSEKPIRGLICSVGKINILKSRFSFWRKIL